MPNEPKQTYNFTVFLALLGSVSVKAARRTLIKLMPSDKNEVMRNAT